MYGPVDLEGHLAPDGRFYLLDFSRVMPPETPKPGMRMVRACVCARACVCVLTARRPTCTGCCDPNLSAHTKSPSALVRLSLVLFVSL